MSSYAQRAATADERLFAILARNARPPLTDKADRSPSAYPSVSNVSDHTPLISRETQGDVSTSPIVATPNAAPPVTDKADERLPAGSNAPRRVTDVTDGRSLDDDHEVSATVVIDIADSVQGHPSFALSCRSALRAGPLPDMPPRRWEMFLIDAPRLCADWSDKAAALGWQPVDFFSSDAAAPWRRIDKLGLAYLLDGHAVIAMDERQARLGNGSSSFYRPQ
ncbi:MULTISPECIES: hypothetical protein [unclassified Beijerinckia]|uniref:hypothetical protein n=1 Tax=unclassified Beijerinckia TaxID=2638183 RepID=UPI000895FBC0|nr:MULTISPECIES: hypothetical protein [unclassified Beijerinckia]MDH7797518.1 hypothetical protein [Beijerinckia sp. GAS462]SEC88820.1 hypothetical protein SAMN05443249_3812 [Beijerinckia sp. 28-YEA-48]